MGPCRDDIISAMDVKIEPSWKEQLQAEFSKPYFLQIVSHLKVERAAGKTIYPLGSQIFNAFDKTPWDKIKVVLLGQDPYHNLDRKSTRLNSSHQI